MSSLLFRQAVETCFPFAVSCPHAIAVTIMPPFVGVVYETGFFHAHFQNFAVFALGQQNFFAGGFDFRRKGTVTGAHIVFRTVRAAKGYVHGAACLVSAKSGSREPDFWLGVPALARTYSDVPGGFARAFAPSGTPALSLSGRRNRFSGSNSPAEVFGLFLTARKRFGGDIRWVEPVNFRTETVRRPLLYQPAVRCFL